MPNQEHTTTLFTWDKIDDRLTSEHRVLLESIDRILKAAIPQMKATSLASNVFEALLNPFTTAKATDSANIPVTTFLKALEDPAFLKEVMKRYAFIKQGKRFSRDRHDFAVTDKAKIEKAEETDRFAAGHLKVKGDQDIVITQVQLEQQLTRAFEDILLPGQDIDKLTALIPTILPVFDTILSSEKFSVVAAQTLESMWNAQHAILSKIHPNLIHLFENGLADFDDTLSFAAKNLNPNSPKITKIFQQWKANSAAQGEESAEEIKDRLAKLKKAEKAFAKAIEYQLDLKPIAKTINDTVATLAPTQISQIAPLLSALVESNLLSEEQLNDILPKIAVIQQYNIAIKHLNTLGRYITYDRDVIYFKSEADKLQNEIIASLKNIPMAEIRDLISNNKVNIAAIIPAIFTFAPEFKPFEGLVGMDLLNVIEQLLTPPPELAQAPGQTLNYLFKDDGSIDAEKIFKAFYNNSALTSHLLKILSKVTSQVLTAALSDNLKTMAAPLATLVQGIGAIPAETLQSLMTAEGGLNAVATLKYLQGENPVLAPLLGAVKSVNKDAFTKELPEYFQPIGEQIYNLIQKIGTTPDPQTLNDIGKRIAENSTEVNLAINQMLKAKFGIEVNLKIAKHIGKVLQSKHLSKLIDKLSSNSSIVKKIIIVASEVGFAIISLIATNLFSFLKIKNALNKEPLQPQNQQPNEDFTRALDSTTSTLTPPLTSTTSLEKRTPHLQKTADPGLTGVTKAKITGANQPQLPQSIAVTPHTHK